MWLLYQIYMILVVTTGISALTKGEIYPGIAGIIGPTLCLFAALGFRNQKMGGLVAAIALAGVGFGIVYDSGFSVGLFGFEITGPVWCAIGLILGFLATPKAQAVERVINKADTDAIFSLTRSGWEDYAARISYPGEEVQLAHFDTGTVVIAFNPVSGQGRRIQPLYRDDTNPPDMLVIAGYNPKVPPFTAKRKLQIEKAAQRDLGRNYSVTAASTRAGSPNGVELTVTRASVHLSPDTVDPSGPKG